MLVDLYTKTLSSVKAMMAIDLAQAATSRLAKAKLITSVALVMAWAWLGAQSLFEYNQSKSLSRELKLYPKLALQFVQWWSQKSMDFSVATAKQSHTEASGWMQFSALRRIDNSIWIPCSQASEPGKHSFLCTSFHAPLVKNAKTITVGVSGLLLTESNFALPLRLITIDFDVVEEPLGLRIADARIVGDPTGQYTASFLGALPADASFHTDYFNFKNLDSYVDRNIGRW